MYRKLGENGPRYSSHRPSAVVNVATDWFTGVRLRCLSKCTVELYNKYNIVIREGLLHAMYGEVLYCINRD